MQINARDCRFGYGACMAREEHQPGTYAPRQGRYEELNVFGSRTGRIEHVWEGERLPLAPRGFTWRHLQDEG